MKYYPSAKSTIPGLIIWGALLVPYGLALYEMFQASVTSELLIRIGILSLVILLFGTIWHGTGYYVSDRHLIVKVGPFTHSHIDISKISEIYKTNSWISSPATSFKRLGIKSGDKLLVLVSPKDQQSFIESLKKINPSIKLEIK